MHKLIIHWLRFWRERRMLFGAMLVLFAGFCVFVCSKLDLTTDIRDTLPEDAAFSEVLRRFDEESNKSTLFLAIDSQAKDTEAVWDMINSTISPYIAGDALPGIAQLAVPSAMYQRLPATLITADYDRLDSILNNTNPELLVRNSIRNLGTPNAWFREIGFVQDPFEALTLGYKNLESTSALSPFMPSDGELTLEDGSIVSIYQLNEASKTLTYVNLLQDLLQVQTDLKSRGIELSFFSPVLIEAGNVAQIRKDINVTMTIAIVCILVILILVYKHWTVPLQFITPAVLGILFALTWITLFKQELSAIAMGAAAVIFGIVLDYSFHFFTSYRRSGSLEQAIRDVANPLLTSCLTTVLAFVLLMFTTSPILQDFGLFAALSLVGAALTVLLILPVFLAMEIKPARTTAAFVWKGWHRGRWLVLAGVIVITVVLATKVDEAKFDANLYDLNYYPEWLQKSEQLFTGIDPDNERRLLFSIDEGDDQAIEELKQLLNLRIDQGDAKGYFLKEVLGPDPSTVSSRNNRWIRFWSEHHDIVEALKTEAIAQGYRPDAFASFDNWITAGGSITEQPLPPSYVVVNASSLEEISRDLANIAGVEVVDLGKGWRSLVDDLKSNFNLILLGTSLLIFFILLVVYGRIELTLITFLPMAISWIWIVGATVLFGIEFNFVNIVLATFIFGLGDDFAIFMSNAHLERYKAGRGDLTSNRVAIFLSATTTLIGMAALLGAQHPALKSLSGLSILGILTIMVISLVVQPILIRMLITDHTKRGAPPLTLIELLASLMTFGMFALFSILAMLFQIVLRVVPGSRKSKSRILRAAICYGCRFILFTCPVVKFKEYGSEHLDFSRPSVIVANHQAFVDILKMVSLSPDVVILTKRWVYYSPLFGAVVRYAGYLYVEHGFEENEKRISALIDQGCSIMIFPEGTRSPEGQFKRWQKGAMFISENFKLDVTPIVLHGYGWLVPAGGITLRRGIGSANILPRISYDDTQYGIGYRARTKAVSKMFRQAYHRFDREHGQTSYQYLPVLSRFIYKGPVIEWYFRVKWMLEAENYERIDNNLPSKGKIYDLGCGLGYTALYLHLRSKEREVVAVDYDDEKIEIAANHYLQREGLSFMSADIREFVAEDADGILLGDVLHYLQAEDQNKVLVECARNLNKGGSILIRDGLRADNDRHKKTMRSERWSTQIYKFNKTDNELYFFDINFLKSFADTWGLKFEQIWESDSTSNSLCVLKKV